MNVTTPEKTTVVPFSLRDAPSLIEKAWPTAKISAETQKERKAVQGQTLTGLGSYWKGRKPLNRPGFPRGFFVQNLRGFFKGVHLCVERLLHFLRRPMTDGAV